ncbi:hypothetical protein SEA_OHMYWARD_43 [Gordonia phage OhMyWard]|uniref:Uncharacterized protein n=1 Tax=Gordonia phage OhMyWard TaxID=2652414 RepID=A0A5P8D7C0_9CAUD|nr:hypothetical protein HWC72_gp43 [Gordonia phage OhMyWard]QFP94925.1 hypothetical protein SEA_OHMYWARD_43 [Gordonia phage OhMyWard]
MIKVDRKMLNSLLLLLVAVETSYLLKLTIVSRYHHLKIETLQDVARYYADMLQKNDVELTPYDIIALNSILERGKLKVPRKE